VGGMMDIQIPEHGSFQDGIKKSALEECNLGYRVARLDNTTGTIRNDELTTAVTAPKIAGRASYSKAGERKNYITWTVATNEINLSADTASRSVVIRLREYDRTDTTWQERMQAFLLEHGDKVAADACAILRRKDKAPPSRHTRFGQWDSAVLACLPDADALVEHIVGQQRAHDTDREEIDMFLAALTAATASGGSLHDYAMRMDPTVFDIPPKKICEMWEEQFDRSFSPRQLKRIFGNAAGRGQLTGEDGQIVLEHVKSGSAFWRFRPRAIPGYDGMVRAAEEAMEGFEDEPASRQGSLYT